MNMIFSDKKQPSDKAKLINNSGDERHLRMNHRDMEAASNLLNNNQTNNNAKPQQPPSRVGGRAQHLNEESKQ